MLSVYRYPISFSVQEATMMIFRKTLLASAIGVFTVSFFLSAWVLFAQETDNPGLQSLDQATDEKLKASSIDDLGKVIALCERAKKEGLSGDNLLYCDQLLGSTLIQRGLFNAQKLLTLNPSQYPPNWEEFRKKSLDDLDAGLKITTGQPQACLIVAQLHLLPKGDARAAEAALKLAEERGQSDSQIKNAVWAMKLRLEKDPKVRLEMLEKAIADAPENNALKMLAVRAMIQAEQPEKAIDSLKKIVAEDPSNIPALTILCDLLTETTQWNEAIQTVEVLEKSLENNATPEQLCVIGIGKAKLLNLIGKTTAAIEVLTVLRGKNPRNSQILLLRSNMYHELEDFDNAVKDIDAAMRLEPGLLLIRLFKAQLFVEQKKFDDAIQVIDDWIQEADTMVANELLIKKAEILVQADKLDEAKKIVDDLVAKNADDPKFYLQRATFWANQNDSEAAIRDMDKAIELAGEQSLLYKIAKIDILDKAKKIDEAIKLAEECLSALPEEESDIADDDAEESDDTEFRSGIGNKKLTLTLSLSHLYSQKKQNKKALALVESLFEKEPDHPLFIRAKANLMISTGQHSSAAELFEKILKKSPNDELILNNYSWLLSTSPMDSLRNGKRALELAEKACMISRYKKSYILSTLAAAYAELGDFDKAVEWSEKCVKLAEKEEADRIDDLKKELEAYKNKQPYREIPEMEE